jgi:dienelactone hydrolase
MRTPRLPRASLPLAFATLLAAVVSAAPAAPIEAEIAASRGGARPSLRLTRDDIVVDLPLPASAKALGRFEAHIGWAHCRLGARNRPGALLVDALRIDDATGRLRFVLVIAHGLAPGFEADLSRRLGVPVGLLGVAGRIRPGSIARHLAAELRATTTRADLELDRESIEGTEVHRLGALRLVAASRRIGAAETEAIERESRWLTVPHRVLPGELDPVGEGALRDRLLDRYRPEAVRAARSRQALTAVPTEFDTPDRVATTYQVDGWRSFWNGCRVADVTFRSPRPSGNARNDLVPAELYEPTVLPENPCAVVLLPIWKGGGATLERFLARHLAAHGVTTLIVPLAWQFGRTPDGVRSGSYTLSDDVERTRDAMFQSVADARAARRWLVDRGYDTGRVSVAGTSLGGHVAALAFSVEPAFAKGAFILAGGDVADLLWNESRETRRIKARLLERGVTYEELRKHCLPFDPLTYASPSRGDRAMIVAGRTDATIPPKNTRALALAFDHARLQWIDANHYTGILQMPGVLADIARFLREP